MLDTTSLIAIIPRLESLSPEEPLFLWSSAPPTWCCSHHPPPLHDKDTTVHPPGALGGFLPGTWQLLLRVPQLKTSRARTLKLGCLQWEHRQRLAVSHLTGRELSTLHPHGGAATGLRPAILGFMVGETQR